MTKKRVHRKKTANATSPEAGIPIKVEPPVTMTYQKLAVIVETIEGKLFQVALNQEMCDCLFTDLKNYFSDGVVKILPDELSGFTLDVVEEK